MSTIRFATLPAAFQHTASVAPDSIALRTPGNSQTLTWRDYAHQVRAFAAGLAGIGVSRGSTVAFMMSNRIEFYPLEVAAQHLGATSFSVYNTLPPEQVAYVLTNAGAQVVLCESQFLHRVKDSGVALKRIICVDEIDSDAMSLAALIASGSYDFDFEGTWRSVRTEDVATLIYTSGTTGQPKGVETTHASLMFQVYSLADVLGIEFGDRTTSYLPTAHIADRVAGLYIQEVMGTEVTCIADIKNIGAALVDLHPTMWGAVPRVWEKLKVAIEQQVAHEPDPVRRTTTQRALGLAMRRGAHKLAGTPVPAQIAAEWDSADAEVLTGIRAAVGLDRVRWAISGAAPIPRQTLEFFAGIGVPICEAWGMSELAAVCSISPPGETRAGTVGKLLPGMFAKLADDGELLIRGPLVMKGYRALPQQTDEVLGANGWLRTGDIATIDEHGYLAIVDRKKDIMINAAGKNISPSHVENTIKSASILIGSIAVIGDARPYNTALVVLDPETAESFALQNDLLDASAQTLARHPRLVEALKAAVAQGNRQLARVEQIKRFRILPTFWEVGAEETTVTMKLKRKVVASKYSDQIEEMYAECLASDVHEPEIEVR